MARVRYLYPKAMSVRNMLRHFRVFLWLCWPLHPVKTCAALSRDDAPVATVPTRCTCLLAAVVGNTCILRVDDDGDGGFDGHHSGAGDVQERRRLFSYSANLNTLFRCLKVLLSFVRVAPRQYYEKKVHVVSVLLLTQIFKFDVACSVIIIGLQEPDYILAMCSV